MKGSRDLLTQIEEGAHEPDSDLPTLLRLCIRLGGETGSERLRAWASRELKGYGLEDDLQPYRMQTAPLQFDGILGNFRVTGKPVPVSLIPDVARDLVNDSVEFRQSIAVIVGMLESARKDDTSIKLGPPGAPQLVALMNNSLARAESDSLRLGLPPSQQIDRIYWAVTPSVVYGIVDQVRTNLVELIAEMRAGTPAGQALPTPEIADQAFGIAILGDKNRIKNLNVTQVAAVGDAATAAKGSASIGGPPESKTRRVAWWLVGGATILGAVTGVLFHFHAF